MLILMNSLLLNLKIYIIILVMKLIAVQKIDDNKFLVRINKDTETRHIVIVSDEAHKNFSAGELTKEQLVKKSFLFLLQKERQTSILEKFNIEEIENYFPEFSNIAKIGWIDISG
ncbi:MAG: hypothetical protein P8M50_04000 [Paracoccaceae bacterium]|nr:hypothetical protein [Paracoccaceae bacterium]